MEEPSESNYNTMGGYLFNKNGGGGFSIDSFMKSPIITLNQSSLKGGNHSKTVTEHLNLGNSLAIPSWVLSHSVNTSSNEIDDNNFKEISSDYENTSVINDDLHDQLLRLVEADVESNSKNMTNSKTKKSQKHALHLMTRSHKPKPNNKSKKHK